METQLCVLFSQLKYILQFPKHFNNVFVTVEVAVCVCESENVCVSACVECVRA